MYASGMDVSVYTNISSYSTSVQRSALLVAFLVHASRFKVVGSLDSLHAIARPILRIDLRIYSCPNTRISRPILTTQVQLKTSECVHHTGIPISPQMLNRTLVLFKPPKSS